ncbi:MAG: SycD/LcrH family type III secretion system chaperone, partial [Chlamydiales bacterium]
LEDFIPNIILKSDTLAIAYGVSKKELEEIYSEGYAFYEEEHLSEASNTFRFLVILDPYIPKFWMGLAATQQLLGDYEKALHSYAMVTLLEKDNPYPHFHASECYRALRNEPEAEIALDIALDLAQKASYHELQDRIEKLRLTVK